MRKLFAVGLLAAVCSPFMATVANASYDPDGPYHPHPWKKVRATEMMAVGLTTARDRRRTRLFDVASTDSYELTGSGQRVPGRIHLLLGTCVL